MGPGSDGPRENESSHHAVLWGKLDMVIPLAAGTGEVGVGTQGRILAAHDGAARVLRPWRLWLAIPLKQREQGINHLEVSGSQSWELQPKGSAPVVHRAESGKRNNGSEGNQQDQCGPVL